MNFLPSVLRTVVPLIVGALITLALKVGLDIDSASVTPVVTAGVTALYYIVVRFLETHANSQFGWLLGLASQPVYVPPVTEVLGGEGGSDVPADAAPVVAYADEPTMKAEVPPTVGGSSLHV